MADIILPGDMAEESKDNDEKIVKCCKCNKKASIVIIDKHGNFTEDHAFCCWCFVKDFKFFLEKILTFTNRISDNN